MFCCFTSVWPRLGPRAVWFTVSQLTVFILKGFGFIYFREVTRFDILHICRGKGLVSSTLQPKPLKTYTKHFWGECIWGYLELRNLVECAHCVMFEGCQGKQKAYASWLRVSKGVPLNLLLLGS